MTPPTQIDDFRSVYRWLSNFHVADVVFEGDTYLSSEHAYQAAKRPRSERAPFLSRTLLCRDAKRLGGPGTTTLDGTWDQRKFEVMYRVCHDKFSRHSELREKLLATGAAQLIEGNTWGDRVWGVCRGEGENNLGKILMRIRSELQQEILQRNLGGIVSTESDLAAVELAVARWQELAAQLEEARALVTLDEEGEALGDLFAGVLPALRLHLEHGLADCLSCGNKVAQSELAERIELAEQYVEQVAASREAREMVAAIEIAVQEAEREANMLLQGAAGEEEQETHVPASVSDPDPVQETTGMRISEENMLLKEYEWNNEQRQRMCRNARRLAIRDELKGHNYSVLPDGALFDVRNKRPVVLSIDNVKWPGDAR